MDYRLNIVFCENFAEGCPVTNIFLIELNLFTRYLFHTGKRLAAAVIKGIHNNNIVPGVKHFNAGMAADKPGAAGYQN